MTRKHFNALAAAMAACRPTLDDRPAAVRFAAHKQWAIACDALADTLSTTNGRFDRGRFLAACQA